MTTARIALGHPMFAESLIAADAALNMLINKMAVKGLDEGSLSLSIKLVLEEKQVTDPDTGALVKAMVPTVRYKASYSVKETNAIDGSIINNSNVLVQDDTGWNIGVVADEQQSLW